VSSTVPHAERAALTAALREKQLASGFRSALHDGDQRMKAHYDTAGHMTTWERLKKRAEKLATRRNRLAHQPFNLYVEAPAGRRYALVSWNADGVQPRVRVGRPIVPSGDALCVLDIAQLGRTFHDLTTDLAAYHETLQGRPAPDFGPRPPPLTLKHIAQRVRRGVQAG
jgi:hypothetical protein